MLHRSFIKYEWRYRTLHGVQIHKYIFIHNTQHAHVVSAQIFTVPFYPVNHTEKNKETLVLTKLKARYNLYLLFYIFGSVPIVL